MRKLKLQVQVSVDGYMGGPNGEMDFLVWDWDEALRAYVTELTETMDCIVLGRKLAEGFIPHWAKIAETPEHPEYLAGKKFTETAKVVFSRTLERSEWPNTVLAKGELAEAIIELKKQDGRDIIAYGGATFVAALAQQGLIDEYHLFVNPAARGRGLSVFREIERTQPLTLVKASSFACGIVVLHYRPKGEDGAG